MHTSLATLSHDCDIIHPCEIIKKKNYNPILPSTFRALGWNVGQGTLQTLLQPVRLLCHSHRGPKSAYGGFTGFIQDAWGVFEGGTWATPKPYMPRTMCSFQLQMPEGVPLTSSSPDSPYRKTLFIELEPGGSKTRMGFRWNVHTVT